MSEESGAPATDSPLSRRAFGVPLLFAVAYSAVGFSLYFALGVVAERGLGLTPLIFLAAGLFFVLTTMSYAEGGAMHVDRGGSSNLARHAFNELVSFVAGWAVLLDLIIVIAIAAVAVPHYLTPFWAEFNAGAVELVTALAVIVIVAGAAINGFTGDRRQGSLAALAIADLLLQLTVIVVGVLVVLDPGALTAELDLFTSPDLEDVIYALVIATVAFAGIEAAADLAPDFDWRGADLRGSVTAGAVMLPLVYAGVAAVALMALPVQPGPDGPATPLGGPFIDDPLLGVVSSFEPGWVSDAMRIAVAIVAPLVLLGAAGTAMLALSRHVYSLATNRQIPSWLGKLGRRRGTPYVAIVIAAGAAIGLALPTDVRFLAGVYAFGAMLAVTIAHVSVLRMRVTEPERPRPYRIPLDVRVGKHELPLPALAGAVLSGLAFVSVIVFHDGARYLGGGWMAFGLVGYVVYRTLFEGTTLGARVVVPAEALVKDASEAEYGYILVPIFGTPLDDDIVSTAGRLADAAERPGESEPALEVVYVVDQPLTVPLNAPPPRQRMEAANAALERAKEIGEEYETVTVHPAMVRARAVGAGIVQAARERGVEVIVMGAEPPTKIRGGAVLGGIGGLRPPEIGPVTEYVLRRAPCPVLITAPVAEREGAAGDGGRPGLAAEPSGDGATAH